MRLYNRMWHAFTRIVFFGQLRRRNNDRNIFYHQVSRKLHMFEEELERAEERAEHCDL